MSNNGTGGGGVIASGLPEEVADAQREGQPIHRQLTTTRRLREDLQNVVRSSITPIIGQTAPLTNVIPSSMRTQVSSSWSGVTAWNSSATNLPSTTSSPASSSFSNLITFQPTSHAATSAASSGSAYHQMGHTSGAAHRHPAATSQPTVNQDAIILNMEGFETQQPRTNQGADSTEEQRGASGQTTSDQEPESGWSQLLNSNPELRAVVNACEQYIPFCVLVFVKSLFNHGLGIVVFIGLVLTFMHSNSVVKHQIGRQSRRSVGPLMAVSLNICFSSVFLYYMFFNNQLSLSAFFIPPSEVSSFVDMLWIVGINDFILKFISVFTKICVTLLPSRVLPYQKRGKFYLFIEVTSQLHRQLAPIQPWLMYLLHAQGEGPASIPNKVLGVFLTAAYMVVKGKAFMKAIRLWRLALQKLLQSTRYGKTPSDEQMKTSGGFCPICQDSYQEPTMLHCKHIFCEECVATWFDRDTTCPMCRAKVSEDPAWRDGSTSQFIQLF